MICLRPGWLVQALSCIFLMTVFSANASAQNQYYVATNGSDSNAGTQSQPWRTISHAVATFSLGASGAVIHVAPGTYSELSSCGGWNASVCINRGGSSSTVRLALVCDSQWSVPSGSGCLIRNSSNQTGITVTTNYVDVGAIGQHGFDISNTNDAYGIEVVCGLGNTVYGPCPTGNSVHVLGNYVHDMSQEIPCPLQPNGKDGIQYGNQHGGTSTDGQVIGNRVSNIGPQSQSRFGGNGSCGNVHHGIYASNGPLRIENNILLDITGYGIHFYSTPCQGVITNNTVVRVGNADILYAGGDCRAIAPGNGTISNNIVGPNASYGIQLGTLGGGFDPCTSSHPNLVANNIFSGNASGQVGRAASCTTVTGSKSEAPTTTFVNYLGRSTDDFNLKAGSLALANGTTSCVSGGISPCTPVVDFAQNTRPNSLSIGAFEKTTVSSTPEAPSGLTATVQ